MVYLVLLSVGVALFMAFLWVFYLAVMNLKRNEAQLTPVAKAFGYPILWLGLVLDFLFNVIVGTVVFVELPKEWLLTGRLQRHLRDGKEDWRDGVARWFCHNFLNPFDPSGKHC